MSGKGRGVDLPEIFWCLFYFPLDTDEQFPNFLWKRFQKEALPVTLQGVFPGACHHL